MSLNIGDRVKQKFTRANRIGTIIDIYEEDFYIKSGNERILFAVEGEYKVEFDSDPGEGYITLSGAELEKI